MTEPCFSKGLVMRYAYVIALGLGLVIGRPHLAQAQGGGSVEGFGALSVNERLSSPVDFGGRVSIDLVPGVQAIGEVGRIGNILPPVAETLLSFTPVDIRASALYGEGGVRFLGAPRSPVNPYVEATVGFARLNFGVAGVGSTGDAIARAALGFLDRTEPIAGAGGGIMFRGGPVLLDLGYRYKQILVNDLVDTLLGQGLRAHQVRLGVGVRF